MNAKDLYAEWTDGESNGMRPKRVQAVREDMENAIEMSIPRRVTEIEGWLSAMRRSGTITKKLRSAAEEDEVVSGDDDEDDSPDDDE